MSILQDGACDILEESHVVQRQSGKRPDSDTEGTVVYHRQFCQLNVEPLLLNVSTDRLKSKKKQFYLAWL